jgi:hypothetical protein
MQPSDMPAHPARGWLPVDLRHDPRPQIVTEASLRWVEFGSTPLSEPFFDHTVNKLRQAVPPAREIRTDVETMLRASANLRQVTPAGIIFHISRCGSTLIANGLRASESVLVASESQPITHLLIPESPSIGPYLTARWNQTRRKMLDSIFSLLAHYRTGDPEPLVIKMTSINTLCMSVVRSYWPDVPCLVVVRDPVEVIVASLQGGGWMSLKNFPERSRELFGWDDSAAASDQMAPEEYCARVLGSFCQSAAGLLNDKTKVLDYEDLNQNRLHDIAAFFKVSIPPGKDKLDSVFGRYAKDPTNIRNFQDDRQAKQLHATGLVRSAAQQWAMPWYSELRGRTDW